MHKRMQQQLRSMASHRKLSSVVGGKSARACDSCVRKRARWYCAADDAFLCQSCDSSVHSANPLARRHERVRLKTASVNSLEDELKSKFQGFTRKARTPRQKKTGRTFNPLHLVPEICGEEQPYEENEEQLLYRVPVLDPFELAVNAVRKDEENRQRFRCEAKVETDGFSQEMSHVEDQFLPSELDLEEFAADVESLLAKGLEDESFDMEGLGLLHCDDIGKERMIKVEDEDIGEVTVDEGNHQVPVEFDEGREAFEPNFEYCSPITCEDEEDEKKAENQECEVDDSCKTFLKLDYEGVMSAWDCEKSPWTTGERPDLKSGDFWGHLGTSATMHAYADHMGMISSHAAAFADGGREARVSRYREKRRTRLFSKKIRYEVRKLNAEKRPRMKGRFVKRANFAASAFLCLLNKSDINQFPSRPNFVFLVLSVLAYMH